MTTKDGYYGSDEVKINSVIQLLSHISSINEKTGEIEIYNDEISEEKRVATMDTGDVSL